MWKFLPYIRKNLLGHRVRTAMTVAGTALLLFLFLFVTSVQNGLNRVLEARDDKLIVYSVPRLPELSQLPVYYADAIRGVSGVKKVLPVKVVVSNCRASTDTVVFNNVDPAVLKAVRPNFRFLSGGWSAFATRSDAALVGRRIAERRGLKPGQSFTVAGVTVQVAGVFASDGLGEENVIYTHLTLLGSSGTSHHDYHATYFEVHLADPEQAGAVATAIDARIKDRFEVPTETKPQKAHYARALADLLDLIGMTWWLGIVCVGVVVVLVASSVVMAAQDRVKEHAVLQTLGYTGRRIVTLMLTESCLISIAGGLLGTIACVAYLMWNPVSLSTEGVSIDFLASPLLIVWGLGLSLIVGLVAGVVPAWQAGRAEIVTSLR